MQDFFDRLNAATPSTWVTNGLLFLNIGVFAIATLLGVSVLAPQAGQLLDLGGNYLPATREQPWRLLSSTFLHAGIIHIGFNMWALRDMGQIAERFYGNWQFLLLYLVSGLFGSLASLYFSASHSVSVGASGAIFGVAGAILAAVYTKPGKMPRELVRHMRRALGIFVAYALFMGFTVSFIDNSAHIGGLVSGFLMGVLLVERFDWDAYRMQAVRGALVAVACAVAAGLAMWSFLPDGA